MFGEFSYTFVSQSTKVPNGSCSNPTIVALWGKINRNVSAFLTNVWRSGALFGSTPQEAFYVKCDDETEST